MIKVSRKRRDVTAQYFDGLGEPHVVTTTCKDVLSAMALQRDINKAIARGYGFAKCKAIMEGDALSPLPRGGKREGAGRPTTDRSPITRQVTESEKLAIDDLLSKMRSAK